MNRPSSRGPRQRREQKRAIETRERILEAAGQVFLEKGYGGGSVADIIFAADASKGAFYTHFKDKLDVAKAIMADTFTMDGLKPRRIKLQEVVDIGMILAYRVATEKRKQAALYLSFQPEASQHDSKESYKTPWPDWIKFNNGQLVDARNRGEIRQHVLEDEVAYLIAGQWSGLALTSGSIDGHLGNIQQRISFGYQYLMGNIAQPEVLPFIDFSVDLGERLYAKFLQESRNADSSPGGTLSR